jgi:hypothetical protein
VLGCGAEKHDERFAELSMPRNQRKREAAVVESGSGHGGGSVLGGQSSIGSDSTYTRALNASRLAGLERAIFLSIYSMLSSNSIKDKIQTLAFIVEPIQLLATNFAATGSTRPSLNFDPNAHRAARGIADASSLLSNPFTGASDFPTSRIDFWVCLALVSATLITFLYVGYRLSFSSTSPENALIFLRLVAMVESTVLFMPTVEVLMRYMLFHNLGNGLEYLGFPGQPVEAGFATGAWILFVLFFPTCVLIAGTAVDVDGIFGQSHGRAEFASLIIKLVLVLVVQLTSVLGQIAAAFIKLILAFVLLWVLVREQPYNVKSSGMFRSGGAGMFVWASFVEVMASLGASVNSLAGVFLLGLVPGMAAGAYLSARRWTAVTAKLPSAARLWELIDSEEANKATLDALIVLDNPTDLDIAVRHVLTPPGEVSGFIQEKNDKWLLGILGIRGIPASNDNVDAHGLNDRDVSRRGETVAQIGHKLVRIGPDERIFLAHWMFQRAVAEQGDSSRLWTSYFNFVHWSGSGSRMRLSAASLARINSLDLRFAVFRYLFEKRRAQVGQGQSTIRYLDLSKSSRTAAVYHQKAYREIKAFWKTLTAVGPSMTLDKLRAALQRIGDAERRASSAFADLVSKHSYSTQVLRSYALFLRQVQNKPEEGDRYLAMADALEEEAAVERSAVIAHQIGHSQKKVRQRVPRKGVDDEEERFVRRDDPLQDIGGGVSSPVTATSVVKGVVLSAQALLESHEKAKGTVLPFAEPADHGDVDSTEVVEEQEEDEGRGDVLRKQSSAGISDLLEVGGVTEVPESPPLKPALKVGWMDATSPKGRRRVSLELADGSVVNPGPSRIPPPPRSDSDSGFERLTTGHLEAAEAYAAHASAIIEVRQTSDDGDSSDGEEVLTRPKAQGEQGVKIIGTAIVESETSNPRLWAGIRRFQLLLAVGLVFSLLFTTTPVALNIDILTTLRRVTNIASSASRRESLFYLAGAMVADMESGMYWDTIVTEKAKLPSGTAPPTLEEATGELLHINYRLIFCGSPADNLGQYIGFVHHPATIACPAGVAVTQSPTQSVQGMIYDIQSDTTDSVDGFPTSIRVIAIPRLADDIAQQFGYFLTAAIESPAQLSPSTYASMANATLAAEQMLAIMSLPPAVRDAALKQLQQIAADTNDELNGLMSFIYNLKSGQLAMEQATKTLEELSNTVSQSFLIAMIALTGLMIVSLCAVPCVMLYGLRKAHFEQ